MWHGWPLCFWPTIYVIFSRKAHHWLPSWSQHRLQWLPSQRPYQVATEKWQEWHRSWWVPAITYTKVWQACAPWKSLARMIFLWNHLQKWHAQSSLERIASFLAFSSTYMNRQILCMDDGPCLLRAFVDTCVLITEILEHKHSSRFIMRTGRFDT